MLIPLNDQWSFYRADQPDQRESVRLPHSNITTPFNYFSQQDYQFVSVYERTLIADPSWQGQTVLLVFMAAAHFAEVYINDRLATIHKCGYTAFQVNIADFLDYSSPNSIKIVADSRYSVNAPPFGGMIDYMTYGGIYREVYLDIRGPVWIEDVFAQGDANRRLQVQVSLQGVTAGCTLRYIMSRDGVAFFDSETEQTSLSAVVNEAERWDIDSPVLYHLTVELKNGTRRLDINQTRLGFRTCRFTSDGCFLNGRQVKLIGLNRHQSYPYVGYAMPARVQRRDAEILKKELHVNMVRTSHYPQSQHFVDACDELGLLVLTEIPGWQHIGDEAWQAVARENVREMVRQYRNHPSIVLWGVRINESQDCDELYLDTNQIAHELDPTRPTCGVRYIRHSHLLEDVYTFNDFSYAGQPPVLQRKSAVTRAAGKAYMITEFNGHMFPTKAFDTEGHRQAHALRHATVLNQIMGDPEIAGGLGWCMCDYNTNKDFGSGDHICYHGVLDMFRNPKLAAAVYAAQSDEETVLVAGSLMNKGEYPQALPDVFHVFTNADSVRLYRGERLIKDYPALNAAFSNLRHPPIILDDFLGDSLEKEEGLSSKNAARIKKILQSINRTGPGQIKPVNYLRMLLVMISARRSARSLTALITRCVMSWGSESLAWRLEAIRDGKVAAVVEIGEQTAAGLAAEVDTRELVEGDTYDVASIRIRAIDTHGNLLPLFMEPVTLTVEGPLELIGPATTALRGGLGGAYVKTCGQSGHGRLTLQCSGLPAVVLEFNINA